MHYCKSIECSEWIDEEQHCLHASSEQKNRVLYCLPLGVVDRKKHSFYSHYFIFSYFTSTSHLLEQLVKLDTSISANFSNAALQLCRDIYLCVRCMLHVYLMLPSSLLHRLHYVLNAPTTPAAHNFEDAITYLNQGTYSFPFRSSLTDVPFSFSHIIDSHYECLSWGPKKWRKIARAGKMVKFPIQSVNRIKKQISTAVS